MAHLGMGALLTLLKNWQRMAQLSGKTGIYNYLLAIAELKRFKT